MGVTFMNFFLPGTASLIEDLDKQILVVLRDGRKLIGTLRTIDHFANIALEDTVERIFVGKSYCDQSLGLFIIRGDNIVLVGGMARETEEKGLTRVSLQELADLYRKKTPGTKSLTNEQVTHRIRGDSAINDGLD